MTATNTAKARNSAAQEAIRLAKIEKTKATKARQAAKAAKQREKAKLAKAAMAAKLKEANAKEKQRVARLAMLAKREADRIAIATAPLPSMKEVRLAYVKASRNLEAAEDALESNVDRFCQAMRRIDSDWLRLSRLTAKEGRELQHNEAIAYRAVMHERDELKFLCLSRGLSNEHKPWSDARIFEEKYLAKEAERAARIDAAIASGKTLEQAEQEADTTGNGVSDKVKLTAKQRVARDLGKVYQAAFKLAGEEPNDDALTKAMDALKVAALALNVRISTLEAKTKA